MYVLTFSSRVKEKKRKREREIISNIKHIELMKHKNVNDKTIDLHKIRKSKD